MAENQSMIPSLVEKTLEKTLDSSVSEKPFLTIHVSTITGEDTSNPDSHAPSSSTLSELSLTQNVENSENPNFDNPSSLSPEILTAQSKGEEQGKILQTIEVSKVSNDQSTVVPTSVSMVTMESLPKEAAKNILVISADGIMYEVISGVSESQRNATKWSVEEGAVLLFENSAPAETTRTPPEGPDPSLEETGQGSSSQ
ncbi:hypothetical protein A4A49_65381, partial [Nicotiana attenuata]